LGQRQRGEDRVRTQQLEAGARHRRAGLEPLDAYSLASIGCSFRVTQFVNQTRGVHALIPKALFAAERRQTISVV